jgi:hypothetical protein
MGTAHRDSRAIAERKERTGPSSLPSSRIDRRPGEKRGYAVAGVGLQVPGASGSLNRSKGMRLSRQQPAGSVPVCEPG